MEGLLAGWSCLPPLQALVARHPEAAGDADALAAAIATDLRAAEARGVAAASAAAPTPPASASAAAAASAPVPVAASAAPAVAIDLPVPFAVFKDLNCVVPRGKHDVEASEAGLVFRPKTAAAGTGGPVFVPASAVTGVFYVSTKANGGGSHLVVSLAMPVLVGKTPHKAFAVSEAKATLAKAPVASVPLARGVDVSALRNAKALGPLLPAGTPPVAGAALSNGEHALGLLKAVCGALFGTVGEVSSGREREERRV